jgi:hypothetical protein
MYLKINSLADVEKLTPKDRLTAVLILAITAPSDEQAQIAADLAEEFTHGLTLDEIEECKATAAASAKTTSLH